MTPEDGAALEDALRRVTDRMIERAERLLGDDGSAPDGS